MPKVEEKVIITGPLDLQHHFDSILPNLHLTETEDSWLKIEKSLAKLELITKSGGYKYDEFPILFKNVAQPIINSLLSERTKLSGTAADLLNSVAPRLGERFESLVHVFAPCLLLICARTNKVALFRAKKCLLLIAKHCKLPSLLPHLREASKDKSQTMRIVSVEVTMMLLEVIENRDVIGKRVADLEIIIKGTATDRDPEVRQWCKRVFEVYVDRWPERATVFTSSFTPTTRRYLALPKTSAAISASTKVVTSRPIAPPAKRVELSAVPRQRAVSRPAKVQPSTNSHASTSYGPSSKPTSTIQGSTRTTRMPSSRSGSGTGAAPSNAAAATTTYSSTDEVIQRPNLIDPVEEKRLGSLRADLLKQATGTPSQGLAARLALEQFEFHLRKKSQKLGADDPLQQDENHDPTPFNIAMAKKQSPLKKAPSRIIVAPPPTVRKSSNEAIKPAQRIISTVNARVEKKEEQEDVFRSRPIEKNPSSTSKITSSISRSLSAREKLLGPSVNATNRAKTNANSKSLTGSKKTGPKVVDIGKENIPPGSKLSAIVASNTPAKSRVMANVQPRLPVAKQEKEPEPEPEQETNAAPALLEEAATDVMEEVRNGREEEEVATFVRETSPSLGAGPIERYRDNEREESPLGDWSKIAESLQSDVPLSASKTASNVRSGPCMSTPIRRPLGALQDNYHHHSQSSPIVTHSKPVTKTLVALTIATPLSISSSVSKASPLPLPDSKPPVEDEVKIRKPMVLAPSRKM